MALQPGSKLQNNNCCVVVVGGAIDWWVVNVLFSTAGPNQSPFKDERARRGTSIRERGNTLVFFSHAFFPLVRSDSLFFVVRYSVSCPSQGLCTESLETCGLNLGKWGNVSCVGCVRRYYKYLQRQQLTITKRCGAPRRTRRSNKTVFVLDAPRKGRIKPGAYLHVRADGRAGTICLY